MMAAEVKTGAIFQAALPQALFEVSGRVGYAVVRDGQRFLMPATEGETRSQPATVVINWKAGIKR